MGEKIVVGPINSGLVNNRTAFNIDNDAFPNLLNAYQWRGRVKRKRGTALLTRLKRFLGTTDGAGDFTVIISPHPIATGIIRVTIGTHTYTDQGGSSPVTMLSNGSGSAILNRTTGQLVVVSSTPNMDVYYNPGLPVMGLEDLDLVNPSSFGNNYPGTIAFDTDYAYKISNTSLYESTDVSFYKNPSSGTYTDYVAKSTLTPLNWNGSNYQQFWTTNYQNGFFATNGITIPFTSANIGMQYKAIVSVTVSTATTATLEITAHGLVVGDFVFVNEVVTTTGINFQTGYVITVTDANNVVVKFPSASLSTNGSGGIAQYLTNNSDTTKDCIRWYDGDPSSSSGLGWVNFCPPLSQLSYSIAGLPADKYYLIGARMIVPFKDRLLFLGPVVQTSSANSQVYLQDTIIYSQNGTPYYTASFTGDPVSSGTTFTSLLVPANQSASASAWFEDQTGFGGFFTTGVDQSMITVSNNEDVLIIGFTFTQARLVYSGNDIIPFNLYVINSEYGSGSTFSTINLDKGVITRGSRGIVITSQTECQRIDIPIPDEVFRISLSNNGAERFCSQRDFINEWIYFTYRDNQSSSDQYVFPTRTLFYNYRDNSWGIFNETYTTYGLFRRVSGLTWQTLPADLTWETWTDPWNSGDSTILNPEVIGGNQQGFIMFRQNEETSEGTSLSIQNISGTTVTSPDHGLKNGDYIIISGSTGITNVNGVVYSVANAGQNTFQLNGTPAPSGTYTGNGLITRAYIPFIQTKQFPVSWDMARKTRLGPQQYLLSKTNDAQVTLNIYLSQSTVPFNYGNIVPSSNVFNSALIYSSVLYTCPESTNLGLTPANTNLNLITANTQEQIWHRVNTSLLGDTVQISISLNDAQARAVDENGSPHNLFEEIELHSIIFDVSASQLLA